MWRNAKLVRALFALVVLVLGLSAVEAWATAVPAEGQAAGQQAGKVSAAIPDESVQRLGQGPEITLKLSDAVNWQDVVRTLQAGRVRVELLDGSLLNIGARSVMRIVKHDAQSQQTEIELNFGRLRAQAVRLSRAGASFQVRTPTAVLGVVGTDFIVNVTETGTDLFVIEGAVVVSNLLAAVAGQVTVHAGEHAAVLSGQAPSPPGAASQSDLQAQMDQTNVGSAPSAGGGGGGGAAAAGASHTGLIAAGAGLAAAGVAGAAVAANQSNKKQASCDPTPLLNQFTTAANNVISVCSATTTNISPCIAANQSLINILNQLCPCLGVSFTSTVGAPLVQQLKADFQKAGLAFPTACQ